MQQQHEQRPQQQPSAPRQPPTRSYAARAPPQVMQPVPNPVQRQRLGDSELVVALDPATNRLLRYQELEPGSRAAGGAFKVDAGLFGERDAVTVRWAARGRGTLGR